MGRILFRNARIITLDPQKRVFECGDLLIGDDRILAIGTIDPDLITPTTEIIEAQGKFLMPGLINTHVHTTQQLGRGLADDVDLLTWLRGRIWPYESSMTFEEQRLSALATQAELIRSGVTAFAEAGGFFIDAIAQAVEQSGLRCALTRSTMDTGTGLPEVWVQSTDEVLKIQEDAFRRWHNQADGRIKVWFGIRTIFNATDELLLRTKALADKYQTGIHMHIAEIAEEIDYVKATRGLPTVEHLAKLGFLGPNLLGAHCVWMSEREIDLFRLHDVKVSHNPAAAMRVLGFARIPEMLSKGITVSIGTDGAPCNNRMDMIDEMYLTALIHKGRTLSPLTTPAETILEMATMGGAKTILMEQETGSLEVGKKADLIVLNPHSIGALPIHDPISAIVYAMHSTNVESTLVDGKWLMKERKLLTIDEDRLLGDITIAADAIRQRAGIVLPDRFPTQR